jgi:hypothetical protein
LKEDAVKGTELTQVSATDKDDNPSLTFSIINGAIRYSTKIVFPSVIPILNGRNRLSCN